MMEEREVHIWTVEGRPIEWALLVSVYSAVIIAFWVKVVMGG